MLERCNKDWTDLKGEAKLLIKRNMRVLLKESRSLSKLSSLEMRFVVTRLKARITFISQNVTRLTWKSVVCRP